LDHCGKILSLERRPVALGTPRRDTNNPPEPPLRKGGTRDVDQPVFVPLLLRGGSGGFFGRDLRACATRWLGALERLTIGLRTPGAPRHLWLGVECSMSTEAARHGNWCSRSTLRAPCASQPLEFSSVGTPRRARIGRIRDSRFPMDRFLDPESGIGNLESLLGCGRRPRWAL
jgi:hypothetical protein